VCGRLVRRSRLSGLVSIGGICDGGLLQKFVVRIPSYLSLCKISAKLDNLRLSYSDLTN